MTPIARRILPAGLLLLADCAKAPAEAPPQFGSRPVVAGAPCAQITQTDEPLKPSQARVFVELAHVASGNAEGEKQQALQVAHLVALQGVEASHPWGPCQNEDCSQRSHSVSIAPQVPKHQGDPIAIVLKLSQTGDGTTVLSQEVTAQHQQPLRLDLPELGFGRGTVILTPYVLAGSGDLIQLLRCKAEEIGIEEIRPQ